MCETESVQKRIHLLSDLRSIHTCMVVIQQLLKERQSPRFKLLCSAKDLVHVLHVLGIVRVQLVQRQRVVTASGLHIASTSFHLLSMLLHLSPVDTCCTVCFISPIIKYECTNAHHFACHFNGYFPTSVQ